ncbi:MAG: 50S ribosomal protein L21 [Candidatus Melainabacteria bacterium RIFOXYA12_FULL_32_12]|nr:MAG: 50S ribosomal protein L21 [Candidatus Melainabacteria bacterium GWF2_32_7]OGI23334.1 MAG: 50S ribosomal protein L21 [Candidatus Melainabacteria bacterium RIFOXYA2_FULL_32_9]OGI30276.1 MAG: 50S ribosomal protein L21 [Candidatus Melainabacteria bacterium RIFOXYA12_FULL_32_12]
MLAVVETGGKQYEVTEGRYIDVELLDTNVDESLVFDKIVMIVDGENTKVGQPYVEGATVKAKVLNHGKDKKIIVYKQRCKKGYRKKQGHRQNYTRVMIESIELV